MEVQKSIFLIIDYDDVIKRISCIWQKESENMKDEEFITEMLKFRHEVETKKVVTAFIDMYNFKYSIVPKMQDWLNKNIHSYVKMKNLRIAFLVSTDIFAKISVQQTHQQAEGKMLNIVYFEDKEQALNWLNSKA